MRVHKCLAFFLSELTKMENLKNFLLKIETKRMRIALIISPENLIGLSILRPLAIPMDGAKPLPEVPVDKWSLLYISAS